jgi:hypothetical protein
MDLVVTASDGFWKALHLRSEVSSDDIFSLGSVLPVNGRSVDDMAA